MCVLWEANETASILALKDPELSAREDIGRDHHVKALAAAPRIHVGDMDYPEAPAVLLEGLIEDSTERQGASISSHQELLLR